MGGKGDRCGGQEGETITEKEVCVWCSEVGGEGGGQKQAIKSSVTCCSDSSAFVCGGKLRPSTMVDQWVPWGRVSAQLADP